MLLTSPHSPASRTVVSVKPVILLLINEFLYPGTSERPRTTAARRIQRCFLIGYQVLWRELCSISIVINKNVILDLFDDYPIPETEILRARLSGNINIIVSVLSVLSCPDPPFVV